MIDRRKQPGMVNDTFPVITPMVRGAQPLRRQGTANVAAPRPGERRADLSWRRLPDGDTLGKQPHALTAWLSRQLWMMTWLEFELSRPHGQWLTHTGGQEQFRHKAQDPAGRLTKLAEVFPSTVLPACSSTLVTEGSTTPDLASLRPTQNKMEGQ